MNKLFLALLFVAASFSDSLAQSLLNVSLSDNSPITVAVDGRYFNKRGTSITVGDLPYGNHTLRIYGISRLRRGRAYQEVIYSGRVRTYQGMTTFVTYNPYTGRVRIYEQETMANNGDGNSYNRYGSQPSDDANTNSNDNYIPENLQGRAMPDESSIENKPAEPVNDITASPASPASPAPTGTLSDEKADKLKTKINAKATDTEKLKELKAALKNETVTTYQVSFMMDWFSFESTKVDFAKWAYDITVDKEDYGNLVQKFSFKNSEEELDAFIKSKQ
jgi:hypothetical protein